MLRLHKASTKVFSIGSDCYKFPKRSSPTNVEKAPEIKNSSILLLNAKVKILVESCFTLRKFHEKLSCCSCHLVGIARAIIFSSTNTVKCLMYILITKVKEQIIKGFWFIFYPTCYNFNVDVEEFESLGTCQIESEAGGSLVNIIIKAWAEADTFTIDTFNIRQVVW